MDEQFFEKLVDFLPKHVSPIPSYFHGTLAFIVSSIIIYIIGGNFFVIDFNQDEVISETEARMQQGVRIAVAVIISLLLADVVFSVSWKRRNFYINKNHVTYRRWFPKIY